MRILLASLAFLPLVACATTDDVVVELAPDLLSSLDGTMSLRATALSEGDPHGGDKIDITVAYTDRNGTDHAIEPLTGSVNDAGVFEGELAGLDWEGSGVVTAVVHTDDGDVEGTATFAVLDRTPPTLTIEPPAGGQVRVNSETTITVHAADEIGISQVVFEAQFSNDQNNGNNRSRSSVVASGSLATDLKFSLRTNDTQAGQMVTLYALGSDLSGNQVAAMPVTISIIP